MKRGISVSMVALVLILALASMGLAYTAWTDSVTISESVTTGTLKIDVQEADPIITVKKSDGTYAGRPTGDLATCTASASGNAVQITADKVYPGFKCETTFKVDNEGSIPVYVKGVTTTTAHEWSTASCPPTVFGSASYVTCLIVLEVPLEAEPTQNVTSSGAWKLDIAQWNN